MVCSGKGRVRCGTGGTSLGLLWEHGTAWETGGLLLFDATLVWFGQYHHVGWSVYVQAVLEPLLT